MVWYYICLRIVMNKTNISDAIVQKHKATPTGRVTMGWAIGAMTSSKQFHFFKVLCFDNPCKNEMKNVFPFCSDLVFSANFLKSDKNIKFFQRRIFALITCSKIQ